MWSLGSRLTFDLKMFRGACRRLGMDDRYATVKDKRFDVMRACETAVQDSADLSHEEEETFTASSCRSSRRRSISCSTVTTRARIAR